MQQSTGKIYQGTKEEMSVVEKALGENLVKLSADEAKHLSMFPPEMRSAQHSFGKWFDANYTDTENEFKCKLRYAFKAGFSEAERIFKKN